MLVPTKYLSKTCRNDIAEILLKVALNTTNHIKSNKTYADYSIDLSNLPFYDTDILNLRCLQYLAIDLMLFTERNHQDYIAYSMDPSNLCCLQNGHIKLKLLTEWTHQTYVV